MESPDFENLKQLCERLGAQPAQAGTMARQLLKRSEQLAVERGITREAAMKHLLQVLVHGRSGEVPPGFEPSKPESK